MAKYVIQANPGLFLFILILFKINLTGKMLTWARFELGALDN